MLQVNVGVTTLQYHLRESEGAILPDTLQKLLGGNVMSNWAGDFFSG